VDFEEIRKSLLEESVRERCRRNDCGKILQFSSLGGIMKEERILTVKTVSADDGEKQ